MHFFLGALRVNPFHSDGLSHTYWDNNYGIVHFVVSCDACQNFYKMMYICPWWFVLSKQAVQTLMICHLNWVFNVCQSTCLLTSIQNEKGWSCISLPLVKGNCTQIERVRKPLLLSVNSCLYVLENSCYYKTSPPLYILGKSPAGIGIACFHAKSLLLHKNLLLTLKVPGNKCIWKCRLLKSSAANNCLALLTN